MCRKALSHMGSRLSSFRSYVLVVGAIPLALVPIPGNGADRVSILAVANDFDCRLLQSLPHLYLNWTSPPAQLFLPWRRESSALTAPDPAFLLRTSSPAEEK